MSSRVSDLGQIRQLIDELAESAFLELASVRPSLGTFKHRVVFFRSRPRIWSVIRLFGPLEHVILVNPKVFGRISMEAARGVLAHELAHALHYQTRGRGGVMVAAWSLLNSRFRRIYERRMDLRAIFRGHSDGLAQYREWLLGEVGRDQYERRVRYYYKSEEIATIVRHVNETPELRERWLRDPPLTLPPRELGDKMESR